MTRAMSREERGEQEKSHHGLAGFRGFLELPLIAMETRHRYQKYGRTARFGNGF